MLPEKRQKPLPIRPSRNSRRLTAWLGVTLLGVTLVLSSGAEARSRRKSKPVTPEIAEKKADLKELRDRIEALRSELATNEGKRAHASDQLRSSEREISKLQRELNELAAEREELRSTLNKLNLQSQTLGKTLAQQQLRLEQLIYQQYLQGSPDTLQLLLNGDDPNQLARDLHYLSIIARERSLLLAEIGNTLKQKKALAEETREEAEELAEIEAEQKQRHAQLQQQRQQRQAILAEITGRIGQQRKEIGHLQQDEKRLSQLVDRLTKLLAARAARPKNRPQTSVVAKSGDPASTKIEAENQVLPEASSGAFSRLKGNLRLPVRGSVTGRFGAPREGGGTWKGLFIRAGNGSEVKAVANGRVVFAEWMRSFGNLLIIDHGDAYLSIYGNNEALLKQVGDDVKGGETVARVGNSGGNPETGLYFELRHQGQPMDPMKWASLK